MNRLFAAILAGAVVCIALMSQTLTERPASFTKLQHFLPQIVPTSPTAVVSQDVYVDSLQLTNNTASPIACTVQDRQGTPAVWISGQASIAAGTTYQVPGFGRWMPGGITWSCTGAGVVGYLQWRY